MKQYKRGTKAANLVQISSSKLNILTISIGFGLFPRYVLHTDPLPVKKPTQFSTIYCRTEYTIVIIILQLDT